MNKAALIVLKYSYKRNILQAFFILLLLTCFLKADAQNTNPGIVFKSSKTDMDLANQETGVLTVKIQNHGAGTLNGDFDVALPRDLRLLTKNHIHLSLMPGDSSFLSVQVFVSKLAGADKAYPIVMKIVADKNTLAETQCNIHIAVKKNMSIIPLVTNILINPQLQSIKIPVSVSNYGNTTQKITVVVKYPFKIEGADKSYEAHLTMLPATDTIVYFERATNKKMLTANGFDINILGLYASGEIFGMSYTKVQSAKSDRRYDVENSSDEYTNNSISLVSQNMFSPNQSYELNGRSTVELPDGRLGFSIDMTTWQNGYSPTMFRNTYLSYQTHNMGLTLGDIYRNYEINLNGKGTSFFVDDTARHNSFEAGYINSNPNLFTGTPEGYPSLGTVGWFSARHRNKFWELTSYALLQKSPILDVNNFLFCNQVNWFRFPDLTVTANVNFGRSTELSSNTSKYSGAAGLNVIGKWKQLEYSSINYLSSGYYPGVRRGATTFSERVSYTMENKSVWMDFDYFKYAPTNFADSFQLPEYGNVRAELGFSKRRKSFSFSISPQYNRETNNSYLISQVGSPLLDQPNLVSFLSSFDINTNVTYVMALHRRFTITIKGGMYNSSFSSGYSPHFNITSNYTDHFFSLNTSIQSGNFYIGEVLNTYLKPGIQNRLIMVNPNVHVEFLRKRGLAEAGVSYLNNSLNGTSILFVSRLSYDILPKTNFYVALNHNRYQYSYGVYQNNIIETGITQKLSTLKITDSKNTMNILVFKDNNHNGVYDEGDSPSANGMVYINDIAFITKNDGTISYKDIPFGNYRIVIENNNGWYAPEQYINFKKKVTLQIPLDRIGTVKGNISFSFKEFSYEIKPEKSGVTITATDSNNKVYTTRTNPDGQYIFYIPEGNYTIGVDPQYLPAEIDCTNNNRQIPVRFNSVNVINFDLSVKSRKLEIKKYNSPSMMKEKRK